MLKKIGIVVAALLLVVGFLLVKDYDSPELGQKLLDAAGDATGVSMTATGFRFNLLSGVELEGVTAKSSSSGRELDFELDRLLFEHRLIPLLSGTVAVERIVLERPQFVVVESDAGSEPGDTSEPEPIEIETEDAVAAEGDGFALEVEQIRVVDGSVVARNSDTGAETIVTGLDFLMENLKIDPAQESLAAISAEGELQVVEIVMDTLKLTDVESHFRLANAVFDLEELVFSTAHAKFAADGTVDFNPVPFTYRMTGQGDPLDLNSMVGASEGFGATSLGVEAEGEGGDVKAAKATGALQMGAGHFPEVGMFAQIDQALGKQVVAGAPYEATEARFSLANGIVTLEPFRFTSELSRLDLNGTTNLEGPIAFDVAVATPRDGLVIEGVGSNMLDVLADDAGWVPVPMTVAGTMEEPRVRPDAGALVAQAKQGAKREVTERATEAAGEALGGLFGGRRKKK